MEKQSKVSIVIPTLNERRYIGATLRSICALNRSCEVLIADGGSDDGTREIVSRFSGVRFLKSSKGRAQQLNAGAAAAAGPHLFFLHADSRPPSRAIALIEAVLDDTHNVGGSFYLKFDQRDLGYRLLSVLTRLNLSFATYGDQGLFMRKETFERLGGFPEQPIMEDYEMQQRLRRLGRFVKVQEPVYTSSRRFEKNGFVRQALTDLMILMGYELGISPRRLKKWYPDTSEAGR